MSKEDYIETQLFDLDPQSFFVEFGFKTRAYGEKEFVKAVENVYANTESDEFKSFLFKEYLEDDFECLKQSKYLDLYWSENDKEIRAAKNMKRKFDHILCREKPESSKPSLKDRRLSDSLSKNNIIDLSNEGNSSQKATLPDFQSLLKDSVFETLPDLHRKVVNCVNEIFKKSQTSNYQRYMKSLHHHYQCPEDALYIYQIISFILNEHNTRPETFDMSSQSMELSEQDYNLIWGPLMKILFSKTCVIIKSGDTVLSNIDKCFKVDYRLGIMINNKFVDIASVEVGKKPCTSKIKEDHVKLVLESKTIINRLINQFHFILPSSLQVISLQICGLKADLLKSTMKSPKEYTTERVTDRLRIPITTKKSDPMISFLQRLTLFREKVLSSANEIKEEFNEAIDRRSSFGDTLSPSLKKRLPNYKSWLE